MKVFPNIMVLLGFLMMNVSVACASGVKNGSVFDEPGLLLGAKIAREAKRYALYEASFESMQRMPQHAQNQPSQAELPSVTLKFQSLDIPIIRTQGQWNE